MPTETGRGPRIGAAALLAITALLPARPSGARDMAADLGRALFEGSAPGISLFVGDRRLPARGMSCAGCHGGDAAGGTEAAAGPAIDGATLLRATGERPAYDAASFAAALREGRRPGGATLKGTMPRFAFDDPAAPAALFAYLGRVAASQRTGLAPGSVTLRREPAPPSAAVFWETFAARLEELAPRGIYGRRVLLSAEGPAFARIGAPTLGGADMPDLFPLAPLIGDENPRSVRGAFATVADQVGALAAAAGGATVIAPPSEAARLAPLLDGRPGVRAVLADPAEVPPDGAVVAIGTAAARAAAMEGAPLFLTADDLPGLDGPPRRCLTVADPRAPETETADPSPPLARYGRAAAETLIEALERCGADCTRAGLTRAFDGLRIAPAGWPALDYGRAPLTGATSAVVWEVCDGRLRRLQPN